MKKIRFFYRTEEFSKRTESCLQDVGVFSSKVNKFKGKQYIVNIEKYARFYGYEKWLQPFYDANRCRFELLKSNISLFYTEFLLRSNSLFGAESLGNILMFIDIINEIYRPSRYYEIYLKKDDALHSVIHQFFRSKKHTNYKIINVGMARIQIPTCLIRWVLFVRLLLNGIHRKPISKKSSTVILRPLGELDTFQEVKKNLKSYDELFYIWKNGMDNIYLLKKALLTKKSMIGALYDYKHYKQLLKISCLQRRKLKDLDCRDLVYKGIDLRYSSKKALKIAVSIYTLLVVDGLIFANVLGKMWKNIIFHNNDDPLLQALVCTNTPAKKISFQYELIYPGCAYRIQNPKQIMIEKEFVWNKYSKSILQEFYNYPASKVSVVGNVRFKKIHKINSSKIRVLLADQPVYPELLNGFLNAVDNTNNANIVFYVKPHGLHYYRDLKNKIGKRKINIIKEDIEKTLSKTDMLITYSSTVVYEALYNKIPIVILNPYEITPVGVPFYKYCPVIKNEELSKFFNELNNVWLKEYVFSEDLITKQFKNSELAGLVK